VPCGEEERSALESAQAKIRGLEEEASRLAERLDAALTEQRVLEERSDAALTEQRVLEERLDTALTEQRVLESNWMAEVCHQCLAKCT